MIEINKKAEGHLLVVEIVGQLIGDEAINLRHNFEEWHDVEQDHVALDLTGVSFIDSTGIGAVVAVHKNLKRAGKQVYFYGASGQVAEMMRFLRIDKVIPSYPDQSALRRGEKL